MSSAAVLRLVTQLAPLALLASARAEEGFWPLVPPPIAPVRAALCIDVDAAVFDGLRAASVRIVPNRAREDHAWSGSFVGPNGLILTCRHVVTELLRGARNVPRDLSRWEYLASTRHDELPCPGLVVERVGTIEEVSDRVSEWVSEARRSDPDFWTPRRAHDAAIARLVAEAERVEAARVAANPRAITSHVRLVTVAGEERYFLARYERFDDVRLVFLPEPVLRDPVFREGRWLPSEPPVADVALLRVYRGGVAVGPEAWLRPADAPVAKGDFVATLGHPARSARARSVAELEFLRSTGLPLRLDLLEVAQTALLATTRGVSIHGEGAALRQTIADELRSVGAWWEQLDDATAPVSPTATLARRREALSSDPTQLAAWEARESVLARGFADYQGFAARDFWCEVLAQSATTAIGTDDEKLSPRSDRLYSLDSAPLRRLGGRLSDTRVSDELADCFVACVVERIRERFEPDDRLVAALDGWLAPMPSAKREVDWSALRFGEDGRRARYEELLKRLAALRIELRVATEAALSASFLDADPNEEERWRAARSSSATPAEANGTASFSFGVACGVPADDPAASWRHSYRQRFQALLPRLSPESPWRKLAEVGADVTATFETSCDALDGSSGGAVVGRDGRLLGVLAESTSHPDWFDPNARSTVVDFRGVLAVLRRVYRADGLIAELTER